MSISLAPDIQRFFSEDELALLTIVPSHVAIIMDGNRRWARQRPRKIMDPLSGHWEGAKNVLPIVSAAMELGIKQMTLFGFSTENWHRPPHEIKRILHVIGKGVGYYGQRLIQYGIKLHVIGDLTPFPWKLKKKLDDLVLASAGGEQMDLVLALNYGGRNELVRAMQKIGEMIEQGQITSQEVTEALVTHHLDTHNLLDPDLVIRTSGEQRMSNFLLWQSTYSEFYTTPALWPDFSAHDLFKACLEYQVRTRRMGK